jgi:hypothetical protein
MARKRRKRQQANSAIQHGWYEGKLQGVPTGFVKFSNPQKKKLSSLV